ncbi:hypothetical protein V1290_004419 [Bradyrhizobium sp. AZCC 1578]|uniref:hypothetical protein n=1 Tax=Bradyrhizobium sp. AZCC 1578 TaxID=3117027 RepID=UPI002FEF77AB
MTKEEFERRLDRAFSKRVRIVAENPRGKLSACWIFWGHKSDFYFGAKGISNAIKVSLHENGRGYVGYDKQYFERKRGEGIAIPAKTAFEWALPVPGLLGAAHAASLILPADYCHGASLSDSARKKTLVLGIEDGSCAEIGVFLSREHPATLESKLKKIGRPMFAVTLDNGMHTSLVVRSRPFDSASLPSDEQTARARSQMLTTEPVSENETLNAILWDAPEDGGAIRVIDVGGVRWKKRPTPPAV